MAPAARDDLALIAEILSALAGKRPASPSAAPQPLLEPLTGSEIRVLRYLPTNLSRPEIANELYLSTNTVKTHIHKLYTKLGMHRRAEAVERARALGLLAPLRAPPATRSAANHSDQVTLVHPADTDAH